MRKGVMMHEVDAWRFLATVIDIARDGETMPARDPYHAVVLRDYEGKPRNTVESAQPIDGLCSAIRNLRLDGQISDETYRSMNRRVYARLRGRAYLFASGGQATKRVKVCKQFAEAARKADWRLRRRA
jgi:hypothetical protein